MEQKYSHNYSDYIFKVDPNFNEDFTIGFVPTQTKELKITDEYNIKDGRKSKFNKNIGKENCGCGKCPENLPNGITHLTFGWYFSQPVDCLPNTLTHLIFGVNFNCPVDNLPESLLCLYLGFNFTGSVDSLPKNLTNLTLSYAFNNTVNSLPKSLISITFLEMFNQSIDNLPNSVKIISMSGGFNRQVLKYPDSLEELSFCARSNIKNQIPDHISIINVYFDYVGGDLVCSNIPPNIKKIRINIKEKINLITKIPFGCVITDVYDNVIN